MLNVKSFVNIIIKVRLIELLCKDTYLMKQISLKKHV